MTTPTTTATSSADALIAMLVRIRKSRGISQAALASMLDVTQPTVSLWENGNRNPTLATVQRYARAIGVRVTLDVEPVDTGCPDDMAADRAR